MINTYITELVRQSGDSSFKYLQNVYSNRDVTSQNVSLALAVSESILGPGEAARVHGGGFAGTIQAFVPLESVDSFCAEMDRLLDAKSCHRLSIRPVGGVLLEVL